jgi:hypothetical protein
MKHQHHTLWAIPIKLRFGLLALSLSVALCGQTSAQDQRESRSEKAELALSKAISYYDKQVGRNSFVYTGIGYYDPYVTVKKNPFFVDDYWEIGSVTYDGFTFDSIYLKYDIYLDLLLIENFNSNGYLSPIKLYSPKVASFQLHGHDFIRIEEDTISKLRTGFYDLYYSGENVQFLVKRRKEIITSTSIGSVDEEFTQKDRYYIKKDGVYHQVRKRRSVLKVFFDQKKEVKAFIRLNNFVFKTNPDLELKEVVKFYDSLI